MKLLLWLRQKCQNLRLFEIPFYLILKMQGCYKAGIFIEPNMIQEKSEVII